MYEALAYSENSGWPNRNTFLSGPEENFESILVVLHTDLVRDDVEMTLSALIRRAQGDLESW